MTTFNYSTYKFFGAGGGQRLVTGTFDFTGTYPKLGVPVIPQNVGLGIINRLDIVPQKTYGFLYDPVAQVVHITRTAKYIHQEDTGTFAAGTAYTLQYKPAYIISIRGTAGSTGTKRLLPNGVTLAAGTCSLNFTTGVITWGDAAITSARIVYVPLGVPGFTPDLLVVDEASPIATNVITPVNQCMAIQYVWNDEDSEILDLIKVGGTPAGAQAAVDIDDGAGATKITVTTGRIGDGSTGKTKLTYIKRAGNPLRFIDQAAITITSNVGHPGTHLSLNQPGIVIPGIGQSATALATATWIKEMIQDQDATVAAGLAVWDPPRNQFSFLAGDAVTELDLPLILVQDDYSGQVDLDIPFGSDISAIKGVTFSAYGI
jgi:hypothetical protein